MTLLTRHAEGLWTVALPHKMLGLAIGTRSTIVRLPSGGLALLSPGPLRDEHVDAIRSLGDVAAIVGPNKFHHLFIGRAAEVFPRAELVYAPGLLAKVPTLPPGDELGDQAHPSLRGALEHTLIRGSHANEVVFFHPGSRTLILTDLAFNIRRGGLWTRIAMTLNGGFGRFGPTKVMRSTVHDQAAFARSLGTIARWDFDRVIVAHGDVIESDARAAFLRAFQPWLQAGIEASTSS